MGIYLYDWDYKELKSVFDKADETQIGWFTEIKEPHGRLIDADIEIKTITEIIESNSLTEMGWNQYDFCRRILKTAPTVIEAEVDTDLEYQMASDMQDYCERYEQTYDAENGSM